jgi:DNA-binding transcriptional LysR family regulator
MAYRLNLRQIEAFRAVFMTGSMTAAGDLMAISQPAVSRLIRDLEAMIGLRLFNRRGTTISPTADAAVLFKEVERSFHGLDRVARAAEELSRTRRGSLRITTTLPVSMFLLPTAVSAFKRRWPAVGLTIHIASSSEVLDLVEMQYYDLGIGLSAAAADPAIDIEPLVSVDAVCVMPKAHPFASKAVIHAEDLAGQPMLAMSGNNLVQPRINRVLEQAGVAPDWVLETSFAVTLCTYVANGVGLAIVDPYTARTFEPLGVVVRRFEPSIPYDFSFSFSVHRARTDLAEAFTALLREDVGSFARP